MNCYDWDYKEVNKYVTNPSCKIIVKGNYYTLVTKRTNRMVHYGCLNYKLNEAILKLWPGEVEK